MTPWTCIITKPATADGHWQFSPAFPVGRELEIDLDSRSEREFEVNGARVRAEVVALLGEHEPKIWIPTELLEI